MVSGAGQPAAPVASTGWRMSWVAASGWDTNETCEAGTSTIVALARSATSSRCAVSDDTPAGQGESSRSLSLPVEHLFVQPRN